MIVIFNALTRFIVIKIYILVRYNLKSIPFGGNYSSNKCSCNFVFPFVNFGIKCS